MNKRAFITFFVAVFSLSVGMASSATVADGIVAQLGKQGFSHISTETTWLGRLRIVGERKDGQREIVINPRTGEILRDQWTAADGSSAAEPILDDVGENSGASDNSGSGSDDHGSGDQGGDGSGSGKSDGGGSDGSGSGSGSGGDGGGSGGNGDGGSGDKGSDN